MEIHVFFWFDLVECDDNKYGLECISTCGKCLKGVQCNHVNGSCPNGCDAGVFDDKCDKGKNYAHKYNGFLEEQHTRHKQIQGDI